MSSPNAAGLIVAGDRNPNWGGGTVEKSCAVCGAGYAVKRAHSKSRFCSLKCVGVSQRKADREWKMTDKVCAECSKPFQVPTIWASRWRCCSAECKHKQHAKRQSGKNNPNWTGGLSRLPYPHDFSSKTSKQIIERDGYACQSPICRGVDRRLTAHHIDYVKSNCSGGNLIALCSSCNSRANFGRERWTEFYRGIMSARGLQ